MTTDEAPESRRPQATAGVRRVGCKHEFCGRRAFPFSYEAPCLFAASRALEKNSGSARY
jgi:hypothetical protein